MIELSSPFTSIHTRGLHTPQRNDMTDQEFMYRAMNEIASGKLDEATERALANSVEQKLLEIRAKNALRRAATV